MAVMSMQNRRTELLWLANRLEHGSLQRNEVGLINLALRELADQLLPVAKQPVYSFRPLPHGWQVSTSCWADQARLMVARSHPDGVSGHMLSTVWAPRKHEDRDVLRYLNRDVTLAVEHERLYGRP